jgi:DNA repair exonuclease SbcCD ATPase subunit
MRLQGLTLQIEKITQQAEQAKQLKLENDNLKDQKLKDRERHKELQKIIDHLRVDLNKVEQDRDHLKADLAKLQKILDDGKKQTQEIGTQTELTADQITQMETDLKQLKEIDLPKLAQEKQQKEQEWNQKKQELENKIKNEMLTQEEQTVISWVRAEWHRNPNFWESGIEGYKKEFNKTWPHLGNLSNFSKLLDDYLDKKNKLENTQSKAQELQTKLDLATKTKEELEELLNAYRQFDVLGFDADYSFPCRDLIVSWVNKLSFQFARKTTILRSLRIINLYNVKLEGGILITINPGITINTNDF